jgi:hypothetical protein
MSTIPQSPGFLHYAHTASKTSETWNGSEVTLKGAIKDAIITYNVGAEGYPKTVIIGEAVKPVVKGLDLVDELLDLATQQLYDQMGDHPHAELIDRLDSGVKQDLADTLDQWFQKNVTGPMTSFAVQNAHEYGPGNQVFDEAMAEVRANNLTAS